MFSAVKAPIAGSRSCKSDIPGRNENQLGLMLLSPIVESGYGITEPSGLRHRKPLFAIKYTLRQVGSHLEVDARNILC